MFFSSPREPICIKRESLFSGKIKKSISICRQLKILPGMLSINPITSTVYGITKTEHRRDLVLRRSFRNTC